METKNIPVKIRYTQIKDFVSEDSAIGGKKLEETARRAEEIPFVKNYKLDLGEGVIVGSYSREALEPSEAAALGELGELGKRVFPQEADAYKFLAQLGSLGAPLEPNGEPPPIAWADVAEPDLRAVAERIAATPDENKILSKGEKRSDKSTHVPYNSLTKLQAYMTTVETQQIRELARKYFPTQLTVLGKPGDRLVLGILTEPPDSVSKKILKLEGHTLPTGKAIFFLDGPIEYQERKRGGDEIVGTGFWIIRNDEQGKPQVVGSGAIDKPKDVFSRKTYQVELA